MGAIADPEQNMHKESITARAIPGSQARRLPKARVFYSDVGASMPEEKTG
jgi:hypothetical protein